MVTDLKGRIVAHSNPKQIGWIHGNDLDLAAIARTSFVTGADSAAGGAAGF